MFFNFKDARSNRFITGRTYLLGGAELGLGYAVDAVQCGFLDTDIFADHLRRDAGLP